VLEVLVQVVVEGLLEVLRFLTQSLPSGVAVAVATTQTRQVEMVDLVEVAVLRFRF
jgi:hypothetical protein